ncbi:ATP-binding protein [Candidatus Oleimmundimicrobium sp.]|uniref:ATP-binding protein n=1 Tax=Candidatus Oleimmundimicrobium sp. TaxID=3060597 RepID=UPI0027220ECA|nr:ATP-binding protein [Candidatus Oleimmundimicrobium sp.]MDO8886503.1 ATP-binding protein [Candidatus Oleimmundimicrobium sp.]
MYRKQIESIIKDLNKKIVFIVGPRQVGKTWLALEIGKRFDNTTYLNYDSFEDSQIIKDESWLQSTELLILDELHKMPGWKSYLKGVFDTKPKNLKILVTGSARLDTFRQTGDSLAGRFFIHRLLPFSISELQEDPISNDIERFIQRGGFPEPFLSEDKIDVKRWRNQYIDGLIRTDILDFERIHDLRTMQMVFELLRRRVGSPVSYASIAGDVNASPTTINKYVQILEALYIIFKVTPYSRNIARSVLKEPKIYFFDNGLVIGDDGAKFENFIALSLLKHVFGKIDYEGENFELKYLRTKDGKEVDFCLANNDQIVEVIEAKTRDSNISKNLKYFCEKYHLKGTQIAKELKRERTIGKIDIRKAHSYLKELFL